MNDWRDFKKSFTQRQEDALWQYLVDHTNVEPNGYYRILFHVRDVDDFWRRVYARYTGDFKRYDKLEKQYQNEKLGIHIFKKMADRMNKNVTAIAKRGTLFDKLILKLYRFSRKYIETYDDKPSRESAANTSALIRTFNA